MIDMTTKPDAIRHDELPCPIEFSVDTQKILMDGVNGTLHLQLCNIAANEAFEVEVTLRGHLIPDAGRRCTLTRTLRAGQSWPNKIQLDLVHGRLGDRGMGMGGAPDASARGDGLFDIEIDVIEATGDRHRFDGQFELIVLERAANMQQVNVIFNTPLIQQSGERSGLGALNEVAIKDLVQQRDTDDVNRWLTQPRKPIFRTVPLFYVRSVEAPRRLTLDFDAGTAMTKCALVTHARDPQSTTVDARGHAAESWLLVHTGDSLVFGRNARDCDVVTWVMPLSQGHQELSNSISRTHSRLVDDGHALRYERWSRSEKGWTSASTLRAGEALRDSLANALPLKFTPLPPPSLDPAALEPLLRQAGQDFSERWRASQRTGIAGVLIERGDALGEFERYLWVRSLVDLKRVASVARWSSQSDDQIGSSNGCFIGAAPGVFALSSDLTSAAMLRPGLSGDALGGLWTVGGWRQRSLPGLIPLDELQAVAATQR